MKIKRNQLCGELNKSNIGEIVKLNGWINTRRDLGGITFVDLRDRYGLMQVRFDNDLSDEILKVVKQLNMEDVIAVEGEVQMRPEDAINNKMPTGEIEVIVKDFEMLNKSKPTPFEIKKRETGSEILRLKYRYLDLRTEQLQRNILIRHKASQATRQFLSGNKFMEIETPFFIKSTPEGARDFVVPSRVNLGKFYALPQSPQTFKQLLMVSGFDKYFQIVKCFRDEDLRADRQPEFTQIDMEMSFIDESDIIDISEKMLTHIFKSTINKELSLPIPQITYDEAMEKYGNDSPDTRFEMTIENVEEFAKATDFKIFQTATENKGVVRALKVENGAEFSRKKIDELTDLAKRYGAKGLAYVKYKNNEFQSGIAKFINEKSGKILIEKLNLNDNDIVFFMADKWKVSLTVLGSIRKYLGKTMKLYTRDQVSAIWVTDFPLFEYNEDDDRYQSMHHPFTSPNDEDWEFLESDPGRVKSRAYDVVVNGQEIGGGSIRIHSQEKQNRVFKALKISDEEAQKKFGFLLKAFEFGAPPHGGIAFGFDRLISILTGEDTIRDVIAFPKTTTAQSLMVGSPDTIDDEQLKELGLKIDINNNENK
ncbi:MAG: aspartate--tRNA ligase [Candidatus Marinimicrobia bacterium]|nr:aspartate--tRNA ligase [Candidatus Neomarinimicrobiota bacterium]